MYEAQTIVQTRKNTKKISFRLYLEEGPMLRGAFDAEALEKHLQL